MALRFSTGLRNALNSKACSHLKPVDDNAAVSFNGDTNTVTVGGSGYVAGSIQAGDLVLIVGATNAVNNGLFNVESVGADTFVTTETTIATDTASASTDIHVFRGGAFKDIFRNGIMRIYTGSQPTSADNAETGTNILKITKSSGAFAGGAPANGLNFGTSSNGIVGKAAGEIWSGVGLSGGTAGWFRFYDNGENTGTSTSHIRFDGACATSGGELNMSSTSIVEGATTTVDSFNVTLMASTV